MTAHLTLIRGLPGSGKSTESVNHLGFKLEADQYHFNGKGVYDWKAENCHKAHRWCQRRTKELLESDTNVVVCNTFTVAKELKPYMKIAEELGMGIMDVTIVECRGKYGSIHSVPKETMDKMSKRYQEPSSIECIRDLFVRFVY